MIGSFFYQGIKCILRINFLDDIPVRIIDKMPSYIHVDRSGAIACRISYTGAHKLIVLMNDIVYLYGIV